MEFTKSVHQRRCRKNIQIISLIILFCFTNNYHLEFYLYSRKAEKDYTSIRNQVLTTLRILHFALSTLIDTLENVGYLPKFGFCTNLSIFFPGLCAGAVMARTSLQSYSYNTVADIEIISSILILI